MTLKREYDNLDGELKHLIAGSDEEILQLEQAARPDLNVELPNTWEPTPRDGARLVQRLHDVDFIERVTGLQPGDLGHPDNGTPKVAKVDMATPLGLDGKPLPLGRAKSMEELEADFQRLVKAIIRGVETGDPEALRIAGHAGEAWRRPIGPTGSSGSSSPSTLLQRMAEWADEFLDEDSPMIPFVNALAAGDQVAMRQAIRPMCAEMVAAEA